MTNLKEQISNKDSFASKGLYDESSGKDQERKVFLGFLKRLQLGHCETLSGERPDFTLNFSFNGKKASIGCEITFYYSDKCSLGSSQQRFVKKWKKFAKHLRVALDKEGQEYKYLYGAIHFKNPDFEIMDKFDNDEFVAQIVYAVRNKQNRHNLSRFGKSTLPLLAKHVNRIYLRDTSPQPDVLWWPSHLQTGEVKTSSATLIDIVREKNRVGITYEWGNVDEKWLLIYGGAAGIADMIVLPSDFNADKLPNTCFDRIYIWDKFFESIHEIYPHICEVFSPEVKVLHRKLYSSIIRPFIISPKVQKSLKGTSLKWTPVKK